MTKAMAKGEVRNQGPLDERSAFSPVTRENWFAWLSERRDRVFQVYVVDPNRLIADFRGERDITRDYEGREPLELFQNAADAARQNNSEGRVRIEISRDSLVVANIGHPFRAINRVRFPRPAY